MKFVFRSVLLLSVLSVGAAAFAEERTENQVDDVSLQGEQADAEIDFSGDEKTSARAFGPFLGRTYDCYWVLGVGLRSNQCAALGVRSGYYTQWLVGLGGTMCDCYGYY